MRELTPHEKRTIRIAAILIGAYLVLFGGFLLYKRLAAFRQGYRQVVIEASDLRRQILPYQDKVEYAKTLMETFRMDPMKLAATSLVAQASAAIQKASDDAGMMAGPIRESLSHTGKEAASIQFETSGPVPAVLALLHNLKSTGYPLVVDSVQMSSDTRRPGNMKLNLTILVLDFDKWKKEEQPNA
ncbi:MAG TPA: hypothetical protein VH619_07325 [Verrucomicrobiae bacterium]|nr:hypothetical protein [Verrucomicrobiae bacterium]